MTIEHFINELNSSLPSIDQIIATFSKLNPGFDRNMAQHYLELNKAKFNQEIIKYETKIQELIYNTNIGSIGIGAINFRNTIKDLKNSLLCFASVNDQELVCLDIKGNQIVSVVEEFNSNEQIAKSVDQFLTFLVTYNRYEKRFIFGTDFSLEELNIRLGNLANEGFSREWIDDLIVKGFSQ